MNNSSISYLVTCKNEYLELRMLLDKLKTHIDNNRPQDEIVVLDDFSDNPETIKVLNEAKRSGITVIQHALNKNFSEHKNYGGKRCVKTFVCQIDADEIPHQNLLENLHELIDANPQVELYRVPRVNIVRGATERDAKMWGWNLSILPENNPIVETVIDDASEEYQFLKKNNLILSEEIVN